MPTKYGLIHDDEIVLSRKILGAMYNAGHDCINTSIWYIQ